MYDLDCFVILASANCNSSMIGWNDAKNDRHWPSGLCQFKEANGQKFSITVVRVLSTQKNGRRMEGAKGAPRRAAGGFGVALYVLFVDGSVALF